MTGPRILVYGYGNPGRLDDGLGPALAAALAESPIPDVTVESNYQLSVEDAAAAAAHDVVIFVDADASGPEPYWFGRIEPRREVSFSTHSLRPEAVLGLAGELLGGCAEGYVLGIRGYQFNEFGERLSERARANLEAALRFLRRFIEEQALAGCAGVDPAGPEAAATGSGGRREEGAT